MQENYFTVHPSKINQNNFSLSKTESNHFLKSLRGKIDDEIWLLDGLGTAYHACVKSIDDQYVTGITIDSFPNYGEPKSIVNLIIGLIKGSRMDMVFEKATELGVKSIQPLLFDHCIKNKLNLKRAERIIVSAAKQSGRSFFPIINEPTIAPGIESSPPITTAGRALSAEIKLACDNKLKPPVIKNPAKAAKIPPMNQTKPKTLPTLIPCANEAS